ncbi:MAG: site-specific DNA-methyltransferase [Promethearchaeati archaeon SRVP18_Atabeyarchaeia-1]
MPPKERKLVYDGKKSELSILADTPETKLKEAGEHGKTGFPDSDWFNMIILGDNLPVLKTLMADSSVARRVRLVYIDPPFSTGQEFRVGDSRSSTISPSRLDAVAYRDSLVGVAYLESLRKRLIFLREIMATDGSIYVHIDSRVGHYVKILLDEVFGEKHFINDIARIKCNPKNFKRRAYGNVKDMILFYTKSGDYLWNDPRQSFTDGDILKLFPRQDKDGRRYATNPLHAPGETENGSTGQTWRGMPPPRGRHWRYPPDELEELDKQGLVEWSSKGVPRKRIYADEFLKKGKKMQDVWNFKDPQFPSYPTEKNLDMLKLIIGTSSNPGDIVLDAYCGSGSSILAAEELGRRWIGIDNSSPSIVTATRRLLNRVDCKFFKLLHATR